MEAKVRWLRGTANPASIVIGLIALALMPTAAAATTAAVPSSSPVTEFKLGTKWIGGFAQGPNGIVWYTGTVGNSEHWEIRLGRIGPSGQIDEEPMAERFPAAQIAVGSEGDIWLLDGSPRVGRVTPAGGYSQVAIMPGEDFTGHATPASGGGIWFTKGRGSFGTDTVGRIDDNGTVTEIPLANPESRPMDIVEANDGDAWFTEYFGDRIGRVSPSGQITEFKLPEGSRPLGIAVDAQDDVWFTEHGPRDIARIDDAGKLTQFTLPADVFPDEIAAASDGRLWFTEGKLGVVGHITPAGRFREVRLPDRESDARSVVAGSEGDVWYAAMGEGPCIGGGYACSMWEPRNAAIVGRISPRPLQTTIRGRRLRLRHRDAMVPLNCGGGTAWQQCRGRLTLEQRSEIIGRARYSLAADQRHLVHIRLKHSLQSVFGYRKTARVTTVVISSDGHGRRRDVTLIR